MRLVTYGGYHLIDDLCRLRSLAVSSILEVNDPFEVITSLGEPQSREQWIEDFTSRFPVSCPRQMKELIDKIMASPESLDNARNITLKTVYDGISANAIGKIDEAMKFMCCVDLDDSKYLAKRDHMEIAMWAYYGHRHQGVRLHLAESFYRDKVGVGLKKMQYEATPPVCGWPSISDSNVDKYVEDLRSTKSIGWEHEAEVRLEFDNTLTKKKRDGRFKVRSWIDVTNEDITRIDLGINMPQRKVELAVERMREAYPSTRIFRTGRAEGAYRCVYDEVLPSR